MATIPGFRFDITGASGSQGLLSPRDGWRAYVLPQGGYASQDSTGTLVTFDSAAVASRFSANAYIQAGLNVANIRQVLAVGGNSLSVIGAALTISENDRIYLIGNTEPTVTGGSATYLVPNTLIYQRDDDGSDLYTNSMITANSNGLIQGFAATGQYDVLVQDGNRANQGSLIDMEVGVPLGISVSDWAHFGSTVTMHANAGVTGSLTVGNSITAKNIAGFRYASQFSTSGSSTGGIQEAISDLSSSGGTVICSPGTYSITKAVWIPSNVHLTGAGIGITIIKRATGSMANGDGSNTGGVIVTGPSVGTAYSSGTTGTNICISELTVDGNYSNFGAVTDTALAPMGIHAEYVDGLVVKNVRSQNTLGDGFRARFCRNVMFDTIHADTVGQWSTVAARNGVNFIGDANGSGEWGLNYTLTNAILRNIGDEAIQCCGINQVAISNIDVDGCDFVFECTDAPLTAGTFRNWTISNISARNALDYFITFNQTDVDVYENVAFSNCVMTGHATLHNGGAVGLPTTSGINLKNFSFTNCTFSNINTADTTTHHWFDAQPGDTTGYDGILISNCVFSGKSGSVRTGDIGINIRGAIRNALIDNTLLRNVSGAGVRLNDTTSVAGITMQDVIISNTTVDTATGQGFRVTSATATSSGAMKNLHFVNCTARNTNTVTVGAGFDCNISQAGASIQNVFYRGCRAYNAGGTSMTHGLILTQSGGTLDSITVENCDFSGTQTDWMSSSGTVTNVHFKSRAGRGTNIATAATISIPQDGDVFHVTGVTNITNAITVNPWDNGRVVTLIFDSTPTLSDTGNSVLAGNFIATADDTITLRCDGTKWYETARSAN